MPFISQSIKIAGTEYDRRAKLTKEDKEDILRDHKEGYSQRFIARRYGVSRRTIQFIIDPSKHLDNLERRKERGGWQQYYDKESWRVAMAEHRNYKQKLYIQGLITPEMKGD